MDTEDYSEIYFSDSDDFQDEQLIGALNQKDRVLICWYCNKPNHVITNCYDKKNGKAPNPNGKWAKNKEAFKNKNKGEKPKPKGVNMIDQDNIEDDTKLVAEPVDELYHEMTDIVNYLPF